MCCGTVSLPICWKVARTFAPCRICSATRTWPRRRFTPMSWPSRGWGLEAHWMRKSQRLKSKVWSLKSNSQGSSVRIREIRVWKRPCPHWFILKQEIGKQGHSHPMGLCKSEMTLIFPGKQEVLRATFQKRFRKMWHTNLLAALRQQGAESKTWNRR